jgi:hypothetical protein
MVLHCSAYKVEKEKHPYFKDSLLPYKSENYERKSDLLVRESSAQSVNNLSFISSSDSSGSSEADP